MAKRDRLLEKLEKAYEAEREKESEDLHNAIVDVLYEHKASLESEILVLEIIKMELLAAKLKEIMGIVKLGDKPPVKRAKE